MKVTLIGIDLAKNVFQVAGVNQAGKIVFNKQVKRAKLMSLLVQYPEAMMAMEACSGSNFWGRELQRQGFKVALIPPIHVKPFVKGNKNDRNDAFAITEAARRPNMVFVQPRGLEQTDLIQVHKLKQRRIAARTALTNQLRGFLNEYGIVLSQGKENLFKAIPELLEDAENGLTPQARHLIVDIQDELIVLNRAIEKLEKQIITQAKDNEDTNRLMGLKGVGPTIATAFVAAIGNGSQFKNGRHCAANLGLVPRENSSGGKQILGGITKRGNSYLRYLLVQGAWSVLQNVDKCDECLSQWVKRISERRGKHKAVVALANKMTRIMWAMLNKRTHYNEHKATV